MVLIYIFVFEKEKENQRALSFQNQIYFNYLLINLLSAVGLGCRRLLFILKGRGCKLCVAVFFKKAAGPQFHLIPHPIFRVFEVYSTIPI